MNKNLKKLVSYSVLANLAILAPLSSFAHEGHSEQTQGIEVHQVEEAAAEVHQAQETIRQHHDQGAASTASTDYETHWAAASIKHWLSEGILSGYGDGSVKPDQTITKAELASLIKRAFQISSTKHTSFTDVDDKEWYAPGLSAGAGAGYLTASAEGEIQPLAPVTRVELAQILSHLLEWELTARHGVFSPYQDGDYVPEEGIGSLAAAIENQYFTPSEDGWLQPYREITRAEAIVLLQKALGDLPEGVSLPYAEAAQYEVTGVLYTTCGHKTKKALLSMESMGYGIRTSQISGVREYFRFDETGHQWIKDQIVAETQAEDQVALKVTGVEGVVAGRLLLLSVEELTGHEAEPVFAEEGADAHYNIQNF